MHRNTHRILIAALLLIGYGMAGCSTQSLPTQEPFVSAIVPSPTIEKDTQPFASPLATPAGSLPAASADSLRFALNQPLRAGATSVTGRGPTGVAITLVDVTLSAEPIGSGEIGKDGTFSIDVKPLLLGDRVGVMVTGELPPELDGKLDMLWGEGGIQLPSFGDVFAAAVVTEP
jgi:hypothetical protein